MSIKPQDQIMRGSKLKLLFIDLSHLSSHRQVAVLSTSVVGFFLIGGIVQEQLSRIYRSEFLTYNWYLTLVQLGCFSLFGMVRLPLEVTKTSRIPLHQFAVLAILTITSFGFGNLSLSFINFPTMLLYKSMHFVLQLIGRIIVYEEKTCVMTPKSLSIHAKRVNVNDMASAILVTLGVMGFTLADAEISSTDRIYGVLTMVLVLCSDTAMAIVKHAMSKEHKYSDSEMMSYSSSIGFICLLLALILTKTFQPAFTFCYEHPLETYGYVALSSMFGFLGTNISQTLMQSHGPFIDMTVTFIRKVISLLVSFLLFPKPFIHQYFWPALLFFIGFLLHIYTRHIKQFVPLHQSIPM